VSSRDVYELPGVPPNTTVVGDLYLAGVSTRRVEKAVQQLGVETISKSQVSRLAGELDELVAAFGTWPLDGSPYPIVMLDAPIVKVREAGRIVNVCVVHATGVNREGYRESPDLDIVTQEDGAAWLGVPAGPRRPWPVRRAARHLTRPPRPRRRDPLDLDWLVLAGTASTRRTEPSAPSTSTRRDLVRDDWQERASSRPAS
jgi:hypothetical protein